MNIDLARQMVRVDFAVSRELQAVLQALKAGCSPVEYRALARDMLPRWIGLAWPSCKRRSKRIESCYTP